MMRIKTWATVALTLISFTVSADKPVHVVLLAGQSNMAGSGSYMALSETDQARAVAASSQVRISRNGSPAVPLSYETSQYQLEKRGFAEIFGPELFLGITLTEANPEQDYLFVKVSQGGTALYGAWNPEWAAEKADAVETKEFKKKLKLYEKHLRAIHENLAGLEAQDRNYEIIGMVWMQGENDAAQEVSARSYEQNLKKLIAGYRTTYNVPDMPFVCGQINSRYGDFDEGPSLVRQAFVDVAEADKHVEVIRTVPEPPWTDFPKHDDQVHYNAEGQKRLGTAMAQALLKFTEQRSL